MKSLSRFLFFIIILVLIVPEVNTEAATVIGVSADKTSYQVGDIITVTVKATGASDLYGLKYKCTYDGASLSLNKGSVKSSVLTTVATNTSQDNLSYVGTKLGDVPGGSGDLTLVTMQFTANKEGTTSLQLNSISLSDSKGNLIAANNESSISIGIEKKQVQSTPQGTTSPAPTPKPVEIIPATPNTKTVEKPVEQQVQQNTQTQEAAMVIPAAQPKDDIETKDKAKEVGNTISNEENKNSKDNESVAISTMQNKKMSTTVINTWLVAGITLTAVIDMIMLVLVGIGRKSEIFLTKPGN